MPAHFLHISKTGGSAIKQAIRSAGEPETKFGKLHLQPHPFTLAEVPMDHEVFFCLRDPVSRFVSSFYSRKRQGRPKYFRKWNQEERVAFQIFETPQELGTALAGRDREARRQAVAALEGLRQVKRGLGKWLSNTTVLKRRSSKIIYIARQETLDEDWEQLKEVLGYPADLQLPADEKTAHRGTEDEDRSLDDTARQALVRWYARDYLLLDYCEQLRRDRGWGRPVGELPSLSLKLSGHADRAVSKLTGGAVRRIRVP